MNSNSNFINKKRIEMTKLKMPDVTLDDVLLGKKEVEVELVKGGTIKVIVSAVPWRTALVASSATTQAEAMIQTLLHSLSVEQRTDEFLDSITPVGLMMLFHVAMRLKTGVAGAKKTEAKGKRNTRCAFAAAFMFRQRLCL